jgi:hypothetical protein
MGDERDLLTDDALEQMERRSHAASKPPWQSFIEGRDHWGGDNFIRIGGMDDSEPDMYESRGTTSSSSFTAAGSNWTGRLHDTHSEQPPVQPQSQRARVQEPAQNNGNHPDEARASVGRLSVRATESDHVAPLGQGDPASGESHRVSDHDDPADPSGRGVREGLTGGDHDL